MLQSMHDRAQTWIVWFIVAGLSFIFALFGMSYYLTPSADSASIKARVNGESITLREYQTSLENRVMQLGLEQSSEDLQQQVMQELIHKALLTQIAHENGFVVSPSQVDTSITQMPLFLEDSVFSQARFDLLMRRMGLSVSELKQEIAADLVTAQLQRGIVGTQILPTSILDTYIQMALQTRDMGYAFIPFASFDASPVTEEQALEYYHQHQSNLVSLDQLEIEYVILDQKELMAQQGISAVEAQKLFQEQGEKLAELAFENNDSLQPILQNLDLPLQTSSKLYQDASQNEGIFQNQEIMNTAFSEGVLENDNSRVISISDTQLMVLRQKAFYPSHALSFEEAKIKIEATLGLASQQEQAQKFLKELIQKNDGQKVTVASLEQKNFSWIVKENISRGGSSGENKIPKAVEQALWSMPDDALEQWTTAPDTKGLFLLQLLAVSSPDAEQVKKDRGHFEAGLKALQTQIFLLNLLKQKLNHADIQIYS
jgi:hypothetical protein